MRIHLIQNGLADGQSHFLGLTLGWLEASRDLGFPMTVYGSRKMSGAVQRASGALPVFRYGPNAILMTEPAEHRRLTSFMEAALTFSSDCRAIPIEGVEAHDLIVLDTGGAADMFGLALWLARLPPARRPRVLCQLHHLDHDLSFDAASGTVKGDVSPYRYALYKLARIAGRERIFLCAAGEMLARAAQAAFDHPCLRSPMPTRLVEAGAGPDGPPAPRHDVSVVGGYRLERGSAILSTVLRYLGRRHPNRSMLIQLKEPDDAAPLAAAAADAALALTTLAGNLSDAAYAEALRSAHVTLLPYHPLRYALRTSGVFSEAVACGRVVVAPAATWMGDEIAAGTAAGVTFDQYTAASIAHAVAVALDQLPGLSELARTLAPAWRERHSSKALAAFALRLPQGLPARPPGRPAPGAPQS